MSFKNFADLLELFLWLEKLGCSVTPVHCLLTAVLWHLILEQNAAEIHSRLGSKLATAMQGHCSPPFLIRQGRKSLSDTSRTTQ